jgi:dipeptidyl-peptidase-4
MSKAVSRYLLSVFVFLAGYPVLAQDKLLTMEDAILKARTTLAPKSLRQPQWLPGGKEFVFTDNRNKKEVLLRQSVASTDEKTMLELSQLNRELAAQQADTLARFPELLWVNAEKFRFLQAGFFFEFDIRSLKIKKINAERIPEKAQNTDFNPDKSSLAYTIGSELWIMDASGKQIKIAGDNNPDIVFGQAVHRNEFGINKGTFWSANGKSLAFYKMDQSMVEKYPITDYSKTPATADNICYPMAGRSSHQVSIGIFHTENLRTIFLQTGTPDDHYLTNISWTPDGKQIFLAELNRAQNHMKFNAYDALSGAFIKTLFEEKDEKYTEPLNPALFIPGAPDQFIWQSNRDGYNHLYLFDSNGKLIRQLSKGNWEVTRIVAFTPKSAMLIFERTSQSGIGREVCSVNLKNGKIQTLSEGNGTHRALMTDNGEYFIDFHSSVTIPNRITLRALSGKQTRLLLESDNPLKEYAITTPIISSLKSEAGDTLFTRTFLPQNFDSKKKYPVIVYLYGGPHAQMITDAWLGGANLWFHYMAQKGFLVFTLDNRGSDARGKNFEQATFRRLGEMEMHDQMKGIEYLRSLSYVDTSRIGIHGWSFGGFMTTTMMSRQPGVFKVGVAGGPVIDWTMYEVMYTERYMDTPQENPEGYKANNLLNYISALKGRLMLIHGTSDDVVLWQHSVNYLKKAVDKGVQLDYFIYPGHPHNVLGKDRVHLMEKISRYFFDFL